MAFDLEVQFTGLCLYVTHPRTGEVLVLMPDCRRTKAEPLHEDGTTGVPHVGYMRIDLADLGVDVPAGNAIDGPKYEVIYQFDRQNLDFGLSARNKRVQASLAVPEFKRITSRKPMRSLFTESPPETLLFRTRLNGGRLDSTVGARHWNFSDLDRSGKEYGLQFSGYVTWTRRVNREFLELRTSSFDGSTVRTLRLKPAGEDNVLRIRIANLCSENPLEWEGLVTHVVLGEDKDFKWLYRLLNPAPKKRAAQRYDGWQLPVPDSPRQLQPFGSEDCTGGVVPFPFPGSEQLPVPVSPRELQPFGTDDCTGGALPFPYPVPVPW